MASEIEFGLENLVVNKNNKFEKVNGKLIYRADELAASGSPYLTMIYEWGDGKRVSTEIMKNGEIKPDPNILNMPSMYDVLSKLEKEGVPSRDILAFRRAHNLLDLDGYQQLDAYLNILTSAYNGFTNPAKKEKLQAAIDDVDFALDDFHRSNGQEMQSTMAERVTELLQLSAENLTEFLNANSYNPSTIGYFLRSEQDVAVFKGVGNLIEREFKVRGGKYRKIDSSKINYEIIYNLCSPRG